MTASSRRNSSSSGLPSADRASGPTASGRRNGVFWRAGRCFSLNPARRGNRRSFSDAKTGRCHAGVSASVALGWRGAVDVPVLPATLATIIELTAKPGVAVAEVGRLVASDPSFAVRVLRLVNSSFMTRGNQIASVHKAVSHVGLQGIRNLALTTAATGGADERAMYPFDMARFWEESLRRAAASQVLAETGIFGSADASSAFTAGLLQDLPVLTLIRNNPGKAEAWMNWWGEDPERRRREEAKLLGFAHDEVANALCSAWGLPDVIAHPMMHHHDPSRAPEAFRARCRLHQEAEFVAAVYGADDTASAWRLARTRLAPILGDSGDAAVDRIIEQVGGRVTLAARALGMLVSEQPDLERLRRQAKRSAEMGDLTRGQLVSRVQRVLSQNEALQRELVQMRALLDAMTATEEITGLPNGRALEARLGQEVRRAARSGKGVALLMIALTCDEGVDPIEVQQSVGVALGATMRDTDVVAHLGEGAFEVLLPDTTVSGAFVAARRALAAARAEVHGVHSEPPWSLWGGIACLEGASRSRIHVEPLIRRLRARAQENLRAALEQERPLVRTEREVEPWRVPAEPVSGSGPSVGSEPDTGRHDEDSDEPGDNGPATLIELGPE